jgi:NADH-quinone oxidoreductase subunit G
VGALSMAVTVVHSVGGRFAMLSRRAGDRGALRAGIHPALLPGGRRVDQARDRGEVEEVWGGGLVREPGRDAGAILESAASRELQVLYLVGVDPLADYPDAQLARRAVVNVPFLVVQDIALGEYRDVADAALPAAPFLEKEGHFTDWEGRGQRIRAVRPPTGLARPDWQIFQELSEVLDADMGFTSLDALHQEMGRLLAPRKVRPSPGGSRREPVEKAEGLMLFSYPLLVDEGRLSKGADELKAALAEEPFVEVHPEDAGRLDLEEGARASVRTEGGEVELPVRITDGIAAGAAFVPWNQAGLRANSLFRGSARITATVEPAGRREEVAS